MQVNRRWAIGSIVGGIAGLFGVKLEAKHPKKTMLFMSYRSLAISPDKIKDPIHNTLKKYDICFQRVTLKTDLDSVYVEPFTNIVTKNEGIYVSLNFDMKYPTIDQFIESCLKSNKEMKYFMYIVGLNGKRNILASEVPYYLLKSNPDQQPCTIEYLKGYNV